MRFGFFRRLGMECLESRWLLATFAELGTTLNLGLGSNESLAIVSTGSTYGLSLGATGTWSGTP
ncbi:MAG TPA: hypothetical protein VHY20_13110, partial [Pirellulales bacterium]|nr:hypothetical protein [Pirellulales bacterium]